MTGRALFEVGDYRIVGAGNGVVIERFAYLDTPHAEISRAWRPLAAAATAIEAVGAIDRWMTAQEVLRDV